MKIVLVTFSSSFKIYAYKKPLFMELQEGEFVIVPTNDGYSVARVEALISSIDYFKNNMYLQLKKIYKKINLPKKYKTKEN